MTNTEIHGTLLDWYRTLPPYENASTWENQPTHLARIKILSDGTPANTFIIDEVTGEPIHRVSKVSLEIGAGSKYAKAKLEIELYETDINAYLEEIKIGNITYKPV